jgi:hypothetical protein
MPRVEVGEGKDWTKAAMIMYEEVGGDVDSGSASIDQNGTVRCVCHERFSGPCSM